MQYRVKRVVMQRSRGGKIVSWISLQCERETCVRIRFALASFAVLTLLNANAAQAFDECGELANAYGPYDYRTSRDQLAIVESVHFTPEVEALRSGSSSSLGGDIDYTLRASPNHPRALIAMANLGRKLNTDQPPGAKYTIPCYFDRAVRFADNDPMVRLVYGTYLARLNRQKDALEQLQLALKFDEGNANIHYNLGLIYLDLKDYPKAREHAQRAYALGFALPGLRKRLEEAGQWTPAQAAAGGAKPAAPK
jgi:tetratricopeptide (TPR) repeat protein